MPTAPSTEHIDRVAAVHALPFDSLFPCLQHITAQILLSTAPCRAASTTSHVSNAVGFPVRVEAAISRPSSRASCLADSDGSRPGENFQVSCHWGLKAASRRGRPLSPMPPRLAIPASRFLSDKTSSSCLGRLLPLLPNIHHLGYCTLTVAWACGLLLLLATPTA